MRVLCLDKASFGKAIVLDNGMLRAPAKLSKPGVFPYVFNGKIVQVFRPPEELFKPEVLASFEQVPLVDEHPRGPKDNGLVTAKNASRLNIGSVAGVREESGYMVGNVVVTDEKSTKKVLAGKVQLSQGYLCKYIDEVGTYQGKAYTMKQTEISGNHVALTDLGRNGSDIRIELDSADVMVECDEMADDVVSPPTQTEVKKMSEKTLAKITLDGLDFEVEPTVAQAVEKTTAVQSKLLAEATARADAAESKVKALDSALADAQAPAKLQAAVAARVAIESQAKSFLAKNTDVSKMTETEIKKAVIIALDSGAQMDGKSDDYVQALYDATTRLAIKNPKNPLTEAVGKAVAGDSAPTAPQLSPQEKMFKNFFKK